MPPRLAAGGLSLRLLPLHEDPPWLGVPALFVGRVPPATEGGIGMPRGGFFEACGRRRLGHHPAWWRGLIGRASRCPIVFPPTWGSLRCGVECRPHVFALLNRARPPAGWPGVKGAAASESSLSRSRLVNPHGNCGNPRMIWMMPVGSSTSRPTTGFFRWRDLLLGPPGPLRNRPGRQETAPTSFYLWFRRDLIEPKCRSGGIGEPEFFGPRKYHGWASVSPMDAALLALPIHVAVCENLAVFADE